MSKDNFIAVLRGENRKTQFITLLRNSAISNGERQPVFDGDELDNKNRDDQVKEVLAKKSKTKVKTKTKIKIKPKTKVKEDIKGKEELIIEALLEEKPKKKVVKKRMSKKNRKLPVKNIVIK